MKAGGRECHRQCGQQLLTAQIHCRKAVHCSCCKSHAWGRPWDLLALEFSGSPDPWGQDLRRSGSEKVSIKHYRELWLYSGLQAKTRALCLSWVWSWLILTSALLSRRSSPRTTHLQVQVCSQFSVHIEQCRGDPRDS
jgi:hypothetical protein